MKKILTIATLLIFGTSSSFALKMVEGKKSEIQKERKAEMVKIIDSKIMNMNSLKICIKSAQDYKAVKKCRQKSQNARKQIRAKAAKSKLRAKKQNKMIRKNK